MNARRALAAAVVVLVAVGFVRAALNVTAGLTGEYFATPDRSGPALFDTVDTDISATAISSHWRDSPPEVFSVRWRGYLVVPAAGSYTFATRSDDGSWLYVDGRLVVDNGGNHEALTRTGEATLDAGPHFVVLEYSQVGGPSTIEWLWGRDVSHLDAVPMWRLSPHRVSPARALTSRACEWLWWVAFAVAIATAIVVVAPLQDRLPPAIARHPRFATFVLFVMLAVVHTWPLASDPAHLSRNNNADTMVNEWALAWFAHQAPRDPLHVFDGNIFYPERRTLAFSEAMPVQGAMAAPLLWLGASPVLAYNVVLIAGFALTGWALCLVLWRWTGDWTAAICGGIVLGFNAHTLTRMPHMQAQHVEFLPLALAALDTTLARPRIRTAVSLAGWFVLQALTSFYLMVFSAVALAVAVVSRPEDWVGKRAGRVAMCLTIAAGVAAVLLLPYLLAYWHVSQDQGFRRTLGEVAAFAATWRDYVTTPGRLPRLIVAPWGSLNALYPGAVATLLAAIAVGSGVALRDRRARMCLAFGVCGVVLSSGPQVPGYALLYGALPPLQGIRVAGRFGYLGIVAVSVLSAYGVTRIRAWMGARAAAAPLLLTLILLVAVEPLAAPIGYVRFQAIPRIYGRVAADRDAVIAELPLASPRAIFVNAPSVLNATAHWRPMVNGYSGFIPRSYIAHYEALRTFPAKPAIDALAAIGVTHIFVRGDFTHVDGIRKIDEQDGIALYGVCRGAC